MSDATRAELERAIEAHMADEAGKDGLCIVPSWIVVTEVMTLEEEPGWAECWPEVKKGQSFVTSLGLIEAYRDLLRCDRDPD